MRIFIGYDRRQPVAFHVLVQSIISRATETVSITPLILENLPIEAKGLTDFTYSRFLVPYLCDFEGMAVFLDADMLVLGDIIDIVPEGDAAVYVAPVEPAFEKAAVMVFDCAKCKVLTPKYIEEHTSDLYKFSWLAEMKHVESIGDLPLEWHHVVGYAPRGPAKLVHFTQGIPYFPETQTSEYKYDWEQDHQAVNHSVPWAMIMGDSVHAERWPNGILMPKFVSQGLPQQVKTETPKWVSPWEPSQWQDMPLLDQYKEMHRRPDIFQGFSVRPHMQRIKRMIEKHGASTLLDYGSGKGEQYGMPAEVNGDKYDSLTSYWGISVYCYDPAWEPFFEIPPVTYGGVICTDVLEHLEDEKAADTVVHDLFSYGDWVFCSVSCVEAVKTLPDGRNCHTLIKDADYWREQFDAYKKPWKLVCKTAEGERVFFNE